MSKLTIYRDPPLHGTPVALAIGNFDGVHLGHQAILQRVVAAAGELGLTPAVMSFEPNPKDYFARKMSGQNSQAPILARLFSFREKAQAFENNGIRIFYALRFNEKFSRQTPDDFIAFVVSLNVKWLLVGNDFRFAASRIGDINLLREAGLQHGFTVGSIEDVMITAESGNEFADTRASSGAVRNALAAGDLGLAEKILGRTYSITGRVIHGKKLGRTLGFPTANISLTRRKPALSGVFAVKCRLVTRGLEGVASKVWLGVANLGTNPAVQSNGKYSLEAFLFDFSGDLYGKRLEIEFVSKIRDEANFENIDALVAQMHDDCARAKRVLEELSES